MSSVTLQEAAKLRDIIGLELCMELYSVCDDMQFEHCTPLDFANFLNLRATTEPIQCKQGEKLRVCYLAYALENEIIPSRHGREWAILFLAQLGISRDTYMKRRTNSSGEDFAKTIEEVLKQWRKRRRWE